MAARKGEAMEGRIYWGGLLGGARGFELLQLVLEALEQDACGERSVVHSAFVAVAGLHAGEGG